MDDDMLVKFILGLETMILMFILAFYVYIPIYESLGAINGFTVALAVHALHNALFYAIYALGSR